MKLTLLREAENLLCINQHRFVLSSSQRKEIAEKTLSNYQLQNTHKNDESIVKKPIILNTFSSFSSRIFPSFDFVKDVNDKNVEVK
jgi:hypothetical protein